MSSPAKASRSSPPIDVSDCVDAGLIVLDERRCVRLWNRWVAEHSGRSRADAMGQPLSLACGGPIDARLEQAIGQVLTRGISIRMSNALHPAPLPLFVPSDPSQRIMQSITLTPIVVAPGQRECLIQISDVTSAVRREALLRQHSEQLRQELQRLAVTQAAVSRGEQRYAQLAVQAPVGIFEINGAGDCVFVNARFCQMTGLSREHATQHGIASAIHPDDRASAVARWSQSQADKKPFTRELRVQHGDGSWIWVRVDSTPLVLSDGQVWHIGTCVDITESRQRAMQYEFRANHDALTGLLSRERFHARLRMTVAGTLAVGGRIALLYIDLDRFKPINDNYGHAAGDAVLKAIAQRLQAVLRIEDQPARLGGDEFAILLSDVTSDEIPAIVADKVHAALRQPIWFAGQLLHIDCSIGIAQCPQDARDPDELLAIADTRMYEDKRHRAAERG